jgi:hypothetical protein
VGGVLLSTNTASAPPLTFGNDQNTGFYNPAVDSIGFTTGGSERMRIDSSGNVGIGTTTPQEKLVIPNNTYLGGANTTGGTVKLIGLNASNQIQIGIGGQEVSIATAGSTYFGKLISSGGSVPGITNTLTFTADGDRIAWGSNRALEGDTTGSLLKIGESFTSSSIYGSLGIGTTTPDTNLQIHDATTGSKDVLKLSSGADNVEEYVGMSFRTNVGGAGPHAAIRALNGPSAQDARLGFFTTTNGGTSLTERLSIDHSGNVGIGTSTPNSAGVSRAMTLTSDGDGAIYELNYSGGTRGAYLFSNSANTVLSSVQNLPLHLNTNDANRLTILGGGNVGIGITGPESPLHIQKSNSAATTTLFIDNNATSALNNAAAIRFAVDGGASVTNGGAQIAAINTNAGNGETALLFMNYSGSANVENMRITSAGKVGIGTTTPSGTLNVYSATVNQPLAVLTNTNTTADASVPLFMASKSGGSMTNVSIENGGAGSLVLRTGATSEAGYGDARLTILSSGNVGIGTTTPATPFEVRRAGGAGSLQFNVNNELGALTRDAMLIVNPDVSSDVGGFLFKTHNGVSGKVNAMSITGAGNVGIGTTDPTTLLSLQQTSDATVSSAGTYGFGLRNSSQTQFTIGYDSSYAYIQSWNSKPLQINNQGNNTIFNFNGGNVGVGTIGPSGKLNVLATTEQLRLSYSSTIHVPFTVDSNGLLTIGDGNSAATTFNQFKLQGRVISTDKPMLELAPAIRPTSIIATAYGLKITPTVIDQISGNEATDYYGLHVSSPTGGGQIGNTYGAYIQGRSFLASLGTGTGGNYLCIDTTTSEVLRGNGAACTASSERFKENIENLDYGLEEVLALRPVSYNYKTETNMGGGVKLGFIAEELGLVLPEVVTYDNNGVTFGLDYPVLTAVLTKAVQELNTKIETLELNLASASTSLTVSSSTENYLVATVLKAFDATLENAVLYIKTLLVDRLIAKNGVVIYDRVTGEPVCSVFENGVPKYYPGDCSNLPGVSQSGGGDTSSPDSTTSTSPEQVSSPQAGPEPAPIATSTPETATITPETATTTPEVAEPSPEPVPEVIPTEEPSEPPQEPTVVESSPETTEI